MSYILQCLGDSEKNRWKIYSGCITDSGVHGRIKRLLVHSKHMYKAQIMKEKIELAL